MNLIKPGKLLIVLASTFFLSSCATSFTGKAHVTPTECEKQCRDWGMKLEGMVAMGEYSSACVCKSPSSTRGQSSLNDLSGYEGSIVAVEKFLRAMRQSAAAHQGMSSGM